MFENQLKKSHFITLRAKRATLILNFRASSKNQIHLCIVFLVFQFDINYSPNDIKIVGITDYDTSMSLPSPEYYGFKDWIPEDVDFLLLQLKHWYWPFIKRLKNDTTYYLMG